MQNIAQALDEVKELYRKTLGRPAPEIDPRFYVPFPPGVDPLSYALEEVGHLRRLAECSPSIPAVTWIPRADTYSTPDGYLIQVEVPGVSREDLKVFTVGESLVVRGVRSPIAGLTNNHALAMERPWGPFERRFAMPAGSVVDGMTARYHEGVLELRLPVKATALTEEKPVEVA